MDMDEAWTNVVRALMTGSGNFHKKIIEFKGGIYINYKGLKTMLLGIVIMLIGIYIGIQSLNGLLTGDIEMFIIIIGAIISICGFFYDK